MSRLLFALVFAALLGALTVSASAQSPASSETAIPSPVASSSTVLSTAKLEASRTRAVVPKNKQSSIIRTNALYKKGAIERDEWAAWAEAPAAIKSFLSLRDSNTATTINNAPAGMYFRVYDLDGDKKDDLILRYGTRLACTDSTGCPNVVYYADTAKRRVMYKARKFLPATGGVFLNNIFYAILPEGGESFDAVSKRMLFIKDVFGVEKTHAISTALQVPFVQYFQTEGEVPSFFYANYDLNKDGKPEIIVVPTQDDDGTLDVCDMESDTCPILIYGPYEKGKPLQFLGKFNCFQDLVVARTSAPGYADLISHLNDGQNWLTVVFSMNPDTGLYERTQ